MRPFSSYDLKIQLDSGIIHVLDEWAIKLVGTDLYKDRQVGFRGFRQI